MQSKNQSNLRFEAKIEKRQPKLAEDSKGQFANRISRARSGLEGFWILKLTPALLPAFHVV